jgi:hypothetical protein
MQKVETTPRSVDADDVDGRALPRFVSSAAAAWKMVRASAGRTARAVHLPSQTSRSSSCRFSSASAEASARVSQRRERRRVEPSETRLASGRRNGSSVCLRHFQQHQHCRCLSRSSAPHALGVLSRLLSNRCPHTARKPTLQGSHRPIPRNGTGHKRKALSPGAFVHVGHRRV